MMHGTTNIKLIKEIYIYIYIYIYLRTTICVLLSPIVFPAENESFLDDQQGNMKHVGNDFYTRNKPGVIAHCCLLQFLAFIGTSGKN
jgi:hypothetical protein